MPDENSGIAEAAFDFDAHRGDAETAYQKARPVYESFAKTIHDILQQSLAAARLNVASIEHRAKQVESFGRKATRKSIKSFALNFALWK